MSLFNRFLLILSCVFLVSCGGGSSSTPNNPSNNDTGNDRNNDISLDQLDIVTLDSKNISKFAETTRQFINDSINSLLTTLYEYNSGPMPIFSIPNSTDTFRCDLGGTAIQTIEQSGKAVAFKYNSCRFSDNSVLDGDVSYKFTNIDRNNTSYSFSFTIENLTTTFQGQKEIINSSFKTEVVINSQSELFLDNASINQQIVYPDINEAYIAKNLDYSGSLNYRRINSISLVSLTGEVALQSLGIATLGYEQDNNRITLKGINEAIGYLTISNTFSEKFIQLEFVDINNKSLGIYAREAEVESWNILTSNNTPPTIDDHINSYLDYEIDQNEILTLDFTNNVVDTNFDVLDFDLAIKNASVPDYYSLTKTGFSKFTFTGNVSKLYELELVVTDPHGLQARKILKVRVNGDTDGDGLLDKWDDDDDNDGILDRFDAFPLNSQESADYDSDGVGDNADTDDDNDGTEDTLDLFPNNSVCTTHENGEPCYLSKISSAINISTDSQGIIYFLNPKDKLIYRWNSLEQHFLKALKIGSIASSDNQTTQMTYSQNHERLYLGYNSGLVSYVDITTGLEHSFYTLPREVRGIASVGKYILIQDQLYGNSDHYIFDKKGILIDKEEYSYYSRVYAWSPTQNRVYFFSDGISPNDLHFEEINPSSGEFISNGETPYHGDYAIAPPIIISPNGDYILIGSGNIFNAADLTWAAAIPGDIVDGLWLDSIGLIVLRSSGDKTLLERRNDNLVILENSLFDGTPRKIISTPNGYFVLSEKNDSLLITPYNPSNDTDGDGVLNTIDHFPLDPAASIDSDNDGYPDYWNMGFSDSDSTTNLTLDTYPQDSACYLPEHGNGQVCDISSTLPDYTPNQAIMSADGVIYFFSKENSKVFRWSIPDNDDLSPIILGNDGVFNQASPDIMTYSEKHNRLYFGYGSGKVTYIDLSAPRLKQQDFINVAQSVRGLASIGDFLLIQDDSGAWSTHYYYNQEGTLTDSNDWNYFSTVYAWNNSLNRVYFFSDDTSPNDLHFEEIDPATGKRLLEGETPYHGDFPIAPPLLISPDETKILIGSGNIFNADNLEWNSAIANTFIAGVWATNGDIITLRSISGSTHLDQYDSNGNWLLEQNYQGTPIGLFEYQNKFYVTTKIPGKILVTEYNTP